MKQLNTDMMTRKCVGDVLHQSSSAHQLGISVFTSRYRTTDSKSSAHTASILTARMHTQTNTHRVTPTAPRLKPHDNTGQLVQTCALGDLDGCEGDLAQTEQFEEGGRLLVEPAQLSLCSRQVNAAETQQLKMMKLLLEQGAVTMARTPW